VGKELVSLIAFAMVERLHRWNVTKSAHSSQLLRWSALKVPVPRRLFPLHSSVHTFQTDGRRARKPAARAEDSAPSTAFVALERPLLQLNVKKLVLSNLLSKKNAT
jgi:hypothetical protein